MSMVESSIQMTRKHRKGVCMFSNPNSPGRGVMVDLDTLTRLANLAGVPLQNLGQGQLAPRQAAVFNTPNEYVIPDDSVRYVENAPELDLNQARNKIVDETFHSCLTQ